MALENSTLLIKILVSIAIIVVIMGISIPFVLIDEKKKKLTRNYPTDAVILRDDAIYIVTDHEEKVLLSQITNVSKINNTTNYGTMIVEKKTGKLVISTKENNYTITNILNVDKVVEDIQNLLKD